MKTKRLKTRAERTTHTPAEWRIGTCRQCEQPDKQVRAATFLCVPCIIKVTNTIYWVTKWFGGHRVPQKDAA